MCVWSIGSLGEVQPLVVVVVVLGCGPASFLLSSSLFCAVVPNNCEYSSLWSSLSSFVCFAIAQRRRSRSQRSPETVSRSLCAIQRTTDRQSCGARRTDGPADSLSVSQCSPSPLTIDHDSVTIHTTATANRDPKKRTTHSIVASVESFLSLISPKHSCRPRTLSLWCVSTHTHTQKARDTRLV